jgi:hypothetical protein
MGENKTTKDPAPDDAKRAPLPDPADSEPPTGTKGDPPTPAGAATTFDGGRPPGRSTPGIYDGLVPWQRLVIVLCAVLLAGLTIVYAAEQSQSLSAHLYFSEAELKHIEGLTKEKPNDVLAHAVQAQAHVKALANQQALCMLGVGAGVALFILGFALSLIGADGAFKIASIHAERNVSASGTTPGILCFVCGTVLIALSVSRTHNIKFVGTTVQVTDEPRIDDDILKNAP